MNKKLIEESKEKLEKEKLAIEQELGKFASKDQKVKGDWDTNFPQANGSTGSQALEEAADQVEEYSNKLPQEHSLELRLQSINIALEKIKNKNYGICENCKKEISEDRLKIFPDAKTCSKCSQ